MALSFLTINPWLRSASYSSYIDKVTELETKLSNFNSSNSTVSAEANDNDTVRSVGPSLLC